MKDDVKTPLARKAVLVSVTISQWTARRLDRKVTDETNERHHAQKDAGRYNKLLIDPQHLAEITALVSKARKVHYQLTQPWTDEGPRILSNLLYRKFADEFRTLKREFADAADRFCAAYPDYVEQRKQALNGMFNQADYPTAEEIRSKFDLDFVVTPFLEAADWRSDLDEEIVAEIRADLETRSVNVVDNAMKHTVTQIIERVGAMATKLAAFVPSGGKGSPAENVFRDSLVENVRELAEVLPAFNLTNDPKLAGVIERIQHELCGEDAKSLRENDGARAAVAKSAEEIVAAVSDLFG